MKLRGHGGFQTDEFDKYFYELMSVSDDPSKDVVKNFGPLANILQNHTITPAKGGSKKPLSEWSDMTYFTHVMNGCLISGRLLEKELLERSGGEIPVKFEGQVRLFFSAVVMHDANKLFNPGREGAIHLDQTLDECWPEVVKVVGDYLSDLGDPGEWTNDLKYLILSAEEGTRDMANLLETKNKRQDLQLLSGYVKLADQVGGIKADTSISIFSKLKKLLWDKGENIHFLQFSDVPQTMIRLKVGGAIVDVLAGEGRVIAKLPDGVVYSGEPISDDVRGRIVEKAKEGLEIKPGELVKGSRPSHNSLKFDFAQKVKVDGKLLDRYIEEWNSGIILWSGPGWKKEHSDFPEIMKIHGVLIERPNPKDPLKFRLQWAEKSEDVADEDIIEQRQLAKLICATMIYLRLIKKEKDADEIIRTEFEDELIFLKENELFGSNCDAIQMDSLLAIAYGALKKDGPVEELYRGVLEKSAIELERQNPTKEELPVETLVDSILNRDIFSDIEKELPSKGEMCIQCGKAGNYNLEAGLSFGIKATSGGGRKITSLKYSDKVNGKICSLCRRENEIRKENFGGNTSGICLQIHLGDYLSPVNIHELLNVLKNSYEGISDEDVRECTIRLKKTEDRKKGKLIQLNYHSISFRQKPKNRIDEYFLLRTALTLIGGTGFKIRVTPLFSADRISKPMFFWENAPAWVDALGWNEIRIDELPEVKQEVDFILMVSQLGRGFSDLPHVINARVKHHRTIFTVAYRFALQKNKTLRLSQKYMTEFLWYMNKYSKEVNKMEMDRIVKEACDIVGKPPKSNNDHTWMMRTALDVFDRNRKRPDVDRIQTAAGRLWEIAQRKNDFSGGKNQTACMNFAEELSNLLESEFKGSPLSSDAKKDIIAQFAIMYNIEKWAQITSKKVNENDTNES